MLLSQLDFNSQNKYLKKNQRIYQYIYLFIIVFISLTILIFLFATQNE